MARTSSAAMGGALLLYFLKRMSMLFIGISERSIRSLPFENGFGNHNEIIPAMSESKKGLVHKVRFSQISNYGTGR